MHTPLSGQVRLYLQKARHRTLDSAGVVRDVVTRRLPSDSLSGLPIGVDRVLFETDRHASIRT